MAEIIRMPKMSDTMATGTIASWLKKEGDQVQVGDILAEVETDKAVMELESYEKGILLHRGVQEKAIVPVGGIIAIIGQPGEDVTDLLTQKEESVECKESAVDQGGPLSSFETSCEEEEMTIPALPGQTMSAKKRVSPLARKMAKEKGYAIEQIQGTGEGGRVIRRDVERFESQLSQTSLPGTFVGEEAYQDVPVTPTRKAIAQRLSESKFQAPHFYLTMRINMEKAVAVRRTIHTSSSVNVSFNDFMIKAAAVAVREHEKINVAWKGDVIRCHQHIHIGFAMAVSDGILVPVVKFADGKSVQQIAQETKMLIQRGNRGELQSGDLSGATFTISNLGMMGVESFTAIINPPAACILSIGAIQKVPVVKDGMVVPAHSMKVTLSCDHRAVDGMLGAAFLKTMKEFLEDPERML